MAKITTPETPTINTLGKGTTFKGDIKSNGDFRIDGNLDGSIHSDGKIVVGASGRIEGEVVCQNADFSGYIKATVKVKELLTLKSTSDVRGEITTNKLAIEPGAKFSGTCSMDNQDPAPVRKEDNKDGSNTEKEKILR